MHHLASYMSLNRRIDATWRIWSAKLSFCSLKVIHAIQWMHHHTFFALASTPTQTDWNSTFFFFFFGKWVIEIMFENDLTEINTLHHSHIHYPGYSIHQVVFVVARCLLLCNAHCTLWLPFLSIIYESCAMLDVTVYSIRPSTSHRKCTSTKSSVAFLFVPHFILFLRWFILQSEKHKSSQSHCHRKNLYLLALKWFEVNETKWADKCDGNVKKEKTGTSAQEWMRQQIVKRFSHLVKNVTRI